MTLIPKETSRVLMRQALTFKKNSPHIFFAAGVAGFVGTVYLSSRATLKLNTVLDEFNEDIENVKGKKDKKDVAYVYGKGTGKLLKLYAPAALLGTASVMSLTGSHVILTRRNSALAGTLAIVTQAFDEYRERVKAELGDDKELDLRFDLKEIEIEAADGTKQLIKLGDPNGLSPYARFFDEYSSNWQKDAEYNRLYVQCQQNYANERLEAYGHVFLNDVYDWLGIERSRAGAVVGWLYNGDGDGYIDFGMFDVQNRDFINGDNRSILLDFNVDGVIFDKI
jgi:Family of unknown function (DUF6353)